MQKLIYFLKIESIFFIISYALININALIFCSFNYFSFIFIRYIYT